jgi:anti-sigma B factor antagonist
LELCIAVPVEFGKRILNPVASKGLLRGDIMRPAPSAGMAFRKSHMDPQISTRESDDVTVLDLTGRVVAGPDSDLLSPHLQELVAKGASKLLLNLTAVTQMDSWSISAIAKTYASLSRQGGSLKILCPSSRIRDVLKVVHLLDLIPAFEDEAEALASFRPRGQAAKP